MPTGQFNFRIPSIAAVQIPFFPLVRRLLRFRFIKLQLQNDAPQTLPQFFIAILIEDDRKYAVKP
jgi:hypothetical protein